MPVNNKKQRLIKIIELMEKEYPDAKCSLNADNPFQLLVATRLSAQCTDARVNIITPALFTALPTPKDFANAKLETVEQLIKSCGLYHSKAKDLIALGKVLDEKYDGRVPDTMEELTALPGIGRKTANLILGDVYGKPAVVVDTHCIRITRRLGLHKEKTQEKIERILKELLPPEESNDFCHRLVLHGRAVCKAPTPRCEECVMKDFCKKEK